MLARHLRDRGGGPSGSGVEIYESRGMAFGSGGAWQPHGGSVDRTVLLPGSFPAPGSDI